jgi:hypothetical protein
LTLLLRAPLEEPRSLRGVHNSLSFQLAFPFQLSVDLVKRLFYVFSGDRNMLQSSDVREKHAMFGNVLRLTFNSVVG